MRNAEIAAAFDELASLYELDGAVVYRVVAYRNAAKAIRESRRSVAELAAAGRADRAAGRGQDDRREDRRAARDRRDPRGREAAGAKFPPGWSGSRACPGLGPEARAQDHEQLGT